MRGFAWGRKNNKDGGAVSSRHVGNSWVPMLGLAFLFLSGAAADLMDPGRNGAVPAHYAFGSLVIALVTAGWFLRHPPGLFGTKGAYLLLSALAVAGSLFGGALEGLRGCAAWLVLGIAVTWFGRLERTRITVTSGVVAVVAALMAILVDVPVLSGILQGATAVTFATLSWRLYILRHGRRRPRRAVDLSTLNLR